MFTTEITIKLDTASNTFKVQHCGVTKLTTASYLEAAAYAIGRFAEEFGSKFPVVEAGQAEMNHVMYLHKQAHVHANDEGGGAFVGATTAAYVPEVNEPEPSSIEPNNDPNEPGETDIPDLEISPEQVEQVAEAKMESRYGSNDPMTDLERRMYL